MEEVKEYQYIPFKVERESWVRYRLEDGAILKTKIVLVNVKTNPSLVEALKKQQEPEKKVTVTINVQTRNIIGVEVPPNLRGPPDTNTYSPSELAKFVVQEDLEFERMDPTTWVSVYELEDKIKLKVQTTLMDVSRTSKYEASGDPIYLVSSTAGIKIVLPKKYRKIKPSVKRISR